jgi:hypothetical protein
VDVPYIFDITDRPDTQIYPYVKSTVTSLVNVQKLERMGQFADYGPGNYTPEDYLDDLTDMIFEELYKGKATDSYRRYLQRQYVSAALEAVASKLAEGMDARTLLLGKLTELQKKTAKAKSSDTATQAHWQDLSKMIEKALK